MRMPTARHLPQYTLMPIQIARGPYPNGYGPLSAMTYLSNKDYLR